MYGLQFRRRSHAVAITRSSRPRARIGPSKRHIRLIIGASHAPAIGRAELRLQRIQWQSCQIASIAQSKPIQPQQRRCIKGQCADRLRRKKRGLVTIRHNHCHPRAAAPRRMPCKQAIGCNAEGREQP